MHKTDYRFYIQKYPQDGTTFQKEDIEQKFDCDYMRFTDLTDGDVKNTYAENFAEKSGQKTFIPKPSELAFSTKECKLRILFKGGNVEARSRQFCEAYLGQKIEWSDTFRGRYATLLMTKTPTVEAEKLYGDVQYKVMEFTFTNLLGQTFLTSQI